MAVRRNLDCSHNSKVTTFLAQEVSLAHPNVEPEIILACCKTHFETLRQSIRSQDTSPGEKRRSKVAAKTKQRKRRLYKARDGLVREEEESVWRTASMDLMSDEEDATLDDKLVWVVRPPAQSCQHCVQCCKRNWRLTENM